MKSLMAVHRYTLLAVMAACRLTTAQDAPVNTSQTDRTTDRNVLACPESVERLRSGNKVARQTAAKDISECRREIVQRLMEVVAGQASDEAKVEATHLLGEYRAKEAVGVLLDNFRIGWKIHVGSMISDAALFPVGDALAQIGEPAIPAIIAKLTITNDKDTQSTYLWMLRMIEPDKQILQLRIQQALDQEAEANRKANLQKAMDGLIKTKQ